MTLIVASTATLAYWSPIALAEFLGLPIVLQTCYAIGRPFSMGHNPTLLWDTHYRRVDVPTVSVPVKRRSMCGLRAGLSLIVPLAL